jgi:hypothetical protein
MISLNPDSLKTWQDLDLESKRYEYHDIKPGELILDIGSYQREWSNMMIHKYGVTAECFDVLDNRGAWTKDTKMKMGGQYYYPSLYEPDNGQWFTCVDIAPFLQQEIAVCKINIEGGEYHLLQYIIAKYLHPNIRNLQVQFHEVKGRPYEVMYEGIASALSETHDLVWRYPYCWESWTRKSEL